MIACAVHKSKIYDLIFRNLECLDEGQVLYFDYKLYGFGDRAGKTKKSYIAEKRVGGKTKRGSVGSTEPWGPAQARKEALKLLAQMASGVDPNAADLEAKAQRVTLAEATEGFFSLARSE